MSVQRLRATLLLTLAVAAAPALGSDTWRFKVFLDRSPIGEHRFERRDAGSAARVESRASFDVDILVFNAYRYRHSSNEIWRGECLEQIRATTDDNGEEYEVQGERASGGFALEVNGRQQQLPACVSTFAYWDKAFLERRRLLNPQTGELVSVRVVSEGSERVDFGGRQVDAERYRLNADGREITLWYTAGGDWVGLESDTGTGRTLRYERL